jgi:hypothetical protein
MSIFKKAVRHQVKLKLGLSGPSGSGKTMGALILAKAIASGERIAVVDTENRSSELYADRFEFDTLNLTPPTRFKSSSMPFMRHKKRATPCWSSTPSLMNG